jgi:hypothetical protein
MFGKDFMMRNENVSSIYRVHERERRVINEHERIKNHHNAKLNRSMLEEETRQMRLKELKHWDNYREAKSLLQEKLHKQQMQRKRFKQLITRAKLLKILVRSRVNMIYKCDQKARMLEENRMAIMIARRWRQKASKKSKSLITRIQNQVRYECI